MNTRGSIPQIIRNDERLYEGTLIEYFRVVFKFAQNLNHPYHNFRHMFHVVWTCYQACRFYGDTLTPREMRNLLIAAMFHDFDHSGLMGSDDLNIERAVRGLKAHLLPEDKPHVNDIVALIQATEYPYKVPSEKVPLLCQIIRDADLSQAFSVAWLQQVVFGLAAEWGKTPLEALKGQGAFAKSLVFHTEWARHTFTQQDLQDKIAEANELVNLIEAPLPV